MQMFNLQLYISTDHNAEKGPTIFPPGPPNPLSCSPFNFLAPLKMNESTSPAIVNTPPMIAHVLHVSLKLCQRTKLTKSGNEQKIVESLYE
jgi:hypothetical protein